ncbi:MAG TPA: SPOR domain-containing protein [Candidatus Angelobacter sp.]|nr:SPOR domain-containing protein [Candidatus Angelobacter sp.]
MAETGTQLGVEHPQDTEIILGTGKLLGIFFGLVVLCTIFFSMGYMLGRNSSGGRTEIVGNTVATGKTSGKPSAADKTAAAAGPAQPCVGANCTTAQASSQAPATTAPPADTNTSSAPATVSNSGPATSAGSTSDKPSGIYMVQVAAVSKREDADILVSALQKKQYPVFVAGVPGDALFHVQVGPFSDPKDAEAMRTRLSADGYNAIVKK